MQISDLLPDLRNQIIWESGSGGSTVNRFSQVILMFVALDHTGQEIGLYSATGIAMVLLALTGKSDQDILTFCCYIKSHSQGGAGLTRCKVLLEGSTL